MPAALALAVTVALALAWAAGGGEIDLPWAPAWELELSFRLDGLGALYALLAAGVGVVVLVYSAGYMPRHLAERGRAPRERHRFSALMLLFLASMVGLATAQDLLLLFVFWDLTAIASYLLIAFDRDTAEERRNALTAMVVTGGSAVLLLAAVVLLHATYGTFSLPVVLERAEAGATAAAAGALVAVAALAKSAQVPLHFWLPRAMVAPTPVSAYLHSAAMVAAGVLLLSRTHELLALTGWLLDALVVVGLLSLVVGGVLALVLDDVKRALAHSTIAQYGYVTLLLGIGTPKAAAAASLGVLAHAPAKSALFLASGVIAESTGTRRFSQLRGLGRRMPALAVACAGACATLAALPLTAAFLRDELLFDVAREESALLGALAVAAAGLTFAYAGRIWHGMFGGRAVPGDAPPERVPRTMAWPPLLLGAAAVAGGIALEPPAQLAAAAGTAISGETVSVDAAYHLDTRPANLMALGAWALGLLVLAAGPARRRVTTALARAGSRAGPARAYDVGIAGLDRLSDRLHELEVGDLRGRVAAVLVPAALLVLGALVASPGGNPLRVGPVDAGQLPLAFVLAGVAVGAVAVGVRRHHLSFALSLSGLGFVLATAYALLDAPDVALVAVLVETALALLVIAVFSRVPGPLLEREVEQTPRGVRRWRDRLIGLAAGAVAFLVTWSALSGPDPPEGMAAAQVAATPEAHGRDVVTVILADLRALDTLVEATVLAVAIVGLASLLRREADA